MPDDSRQQEQVAYSLGKPGRNGGIPCYIIKQRAYRLAQNEQFLDSHHKTGCDVLQLYLK